MRKRFSYCHPLIWYQGDSQESFNPTWPRDICPGHGCAGKHKEDSLTAGLYLLHHLEYFHVRKVLLIKCGSRKPQTHCRVQCIHKEMRSAPTRLQSKNYINLKAHKKKKTKGKVKTTKPSIFTWNKTHFHSYTVEKEYLLINNCKTLHLLPKNIVSSSCRKKEF